MDFPCSWEFPHLAYSCCTIYSYKQALPVFSILANHVPLLSFPFALSCTCAMPMTLSVTIPTSYFSYFRSSTLRGGTDCERGKGCDHQRVAGKRGLQVALTSRNRNFACVRERHVYMESSLRRTRTEIASLAVWLARLRFRLLQYLSCCKLNASLIIW